MRTRFREEEGVAMVTAILVSAIVLMMSVSAVTLAIHNTDASGTDRRRLEAINAAEAGIDFYYSRVLSTSYGTLLPSGGATEKLALVSQLAAYGYALDTTTCRLVGTIPGSNSSTFDVVASFRDPASPSTPPTQCPTIPLTSSTTSASVTLTSVGTAEGLSLPRRTMESKARLMPNATTTTFPNAAIYGAQCVTLEANVDLNSASGRDDADIYVGATCASGPNLSVTTRTSIHGSLYVQGTANVANGKFWARGSLWANGSVTMTGGKVDGAAISSTSTVALSGNTYAGSAKAAGAITVQNPASVYGTQSPYTSGIGPPPSFPYPVYTWKATDWPGYKLEASCATALTDLSSWSTGDLYMYLPSGCPALTLPAPAKVLPGNLGIISAGSITLVTGAKFTNASATQRKVYFFSGVGAAAGTCGDFLANSNSGTGANIKTLVWAPQSCNVTLESNSSFASGQLFGGNVLLRSNSPLTFDSVELPGSQAGSVGSLIDVVYKREITSS